MTRNQEIAQTILAQLGGNRFRVMTGASNMLAIENGLAMKIGRNEKGCTHLRIKLDAMDTYTMEFLAIRGTKCRTLKTVDMAYAEDLQRIFTDNTGLYTSL